MQRYITAAHHVTDASKGSIYVEEHVGEILMIINDKIEEALESNKTSASCQIPNQFSIPSMTLERAQKHVYYYLVKALKDAGYTPTLEFSSLDILKKQTVTLHVKWLTQQDIELERYMSTVIKTHTAQVKKDVIGEKQPPRRRRKT